MEVVTEKYKIPLALIVVHIGLAFMSVYFPIVATIWGVVPLGLGTYFIIRNKDRGAEAALWAGYYAALEPILRVCHASVGYEMSKYVMILFLLLGEILCPPRRRYYIWLFALVLLLPSGLISGNIIDRFESIRFSLSGIVALFVAAFYFRGRIIDSSTYIKLLSFILLPILSLVIIITLKTPDFSSIVFTANSIFSTTGGFGPVHISTISGCGLLILTLLIILRQGVFINLIGNYLVLSLIGMRILLSLSRSGLFSFIIALAASIAVSFFSKTLIISKSILAIAVIAILSLIIWNRVSDITGGMSDYRFTGRNTIGEKKEDITTGRQELFSQEIEMFLENPFWGIGAGNTASVRLIKFQDDHTSHTEYSRLAAEHGIFGIAVLLILIIVPILYYRTTYGWTRLFFVAFVVFSLTSIIPASTRMALPMFIYGLAFLKINEKSYYINQIHE